MKIKIPEGLKDKLTTIGKDAAGSIADELKDLVSNGKEGRARELLEEIALLKMDQVKEHDSHEAALLEEIINDKLSSLDFVLLEERIIRQRRLRNTFVKAAKASLKAIGTVGLEMAKEAAKNAAKGLASNVKDESLDEDDDDGFIPLDDESTALTPRDLI